MLNDKRLVPVCALLCMLLLGCQKKEQGPGAAMMMMAQAVPVRSANAVATDVPLTVSAVGNVEAISSVDVKSRVAGQILRVNFREGEDVRKGQLLFQIDPEPLQRQIAELKANIAKDDALEAQARANVAKDQAQVKQSRSSADRGVALAKEGIYSKEQTEQVVATADAATAALTADQAAVQSASASKIADQAKLAETSLQLEYTQITAPISGRAGAVNVKAGNLIKDNDAALVSILQIAPIYVSFALPEQLLEQVQRYSAHHTLQVAAKAGEQQETGKLQFIDNTVDNTTGTVKLKAVFDNRSRSLWPGQFVNVQAQLDLEHGRILIPSRTLQTGPDGKYVWVVNADDTVAMRPVKVLRLYQNAEGTEEAVIGSGLTNGEKVISEGQMRLAPGAKVRFLNAAAKNRDTSAEPQGAGE